MGLKAQLEESIKRIEKEQEKNRILKEKNRILKQKRANNLLPKDLFKKNIGEDQTKYLRTSRMKKWSDDPHSIVNGMKKCMAIAAVTDITFKEAEMMKEYLADPSKFASAVAAAPAAAAGAAPAAEAKKEESAAEESDDDMGFGLFD